MGTGFASALALALHDSDSGAFSVELSLVAVFSFGSRDLRGRGVAPATEITDPRYSGALAHRRYRHCDGNPACDWLGRFSSHVDFSWVRSVLVPVDAFVACLCI